MITVVDAGSTKSCVLVAELQDGVLRYRGHGIEPSRGMRKGLIAELGPAAEAINRAALTAERTAKAVIETAVVGIGGTHVRGVNSRGGISMGSRMREITREEVRAAVDRARSVALPPDREVLHLLPQEFILDDQAGIHDPMGMVGNKLEVNLHLSTCSGGVAQSVITCANRAGLEVQDTVYEGIAAAEAVLSADERELGVCMADIGSSTTELAVFFEGSIAHTAVLPIGGDHFTNDLAVGLHVTVEEAEELKKIYGHCVVTAVPQLNEIEVGGNLAYLGRTAGADGAAAVSGGDSGAAGAGAVHDAAGQSAPRRRAGGAGRGMRADRRRREPDLVCWTMRRACCGFRRGSGFRCRCRGCRRNWPGRSLRRRSGCCSIRTGRRCGRPARSRGCGRS